MRCYKTEFKKAPVILQGFFKMKHKIEHLQVIFASYGVKIVLNRSLPAINSLFPCDFALSDNKIPYSFKDLKMTVKKDYLSDLPEWSVEEAYGLLLKHKSIDVDHLEILLVAREFSDYGFSPSMRPYARWSLPL